MKRKTMLALMLAVSMTCSMGAATTAMAAEDSATEENAEAADTTEASDADQEARPAAPAPACSPPTR